MTAPLEHRRCEDCNGTAPDRLKRAFAITAVLSAMALVVIDAGSTNLALPSMAAALRIEPAAAIFVATSYQLAVVMALLPSAALGEQFGLRRVFAAGVITFAAAALLSALSASFLWLLMARFIQGLGASAILALGVALLRSTVSDRVLGAALGWNATTVALAAAAGPALGALVLSNFSWHWLYVFELPLSLIALVATRSLPRVPPNDQRLDRFSIALNFAAFGCLIFGLNIISQQSTMAITLVSVSAFAFTALAIREAKKSTPLIPLDLLRNPSFRNSILASILCFVGQTAGLIALPFYLQHILGVPPALAGLYMTAWPLSVAAAAFMAERLSSRASTGALCAVGGALLAAALFAMAFAPLVHNAQLLIASMMAAGVGFGLFQLANNRNMFLAAPITRSGAAGGMQGAARLLGQAGGAALVAQLFVFFPMTNAPQIVMGVAAVFALAAGVISLFRSVAP